ncbi:hypothetical protein [Salinispora tropica]|uniref:hypothetical protein n=1 Tax=Salinispora tropica TaxID=168695 RepID=UPI0005BD03EB|nr:hypothetical protein [Salinispora tropica]
MTKGQLPGGGTVFGNGRRKTQGQLAKIELSRGFGHLKRAAGHATNGTGATVGPRVRAAQSAVAPTALVVRDRAASGYVSTVAALAPLAIAVRSAQAEAAGRAVAGRSAAAVKPATTGKKTQAKKARARRAKKRSGRGRMAGLLTAGAVVGLVGAVALRRRYERREWVEYDPVPSLEPMQAEMDTIEVTTRTPAEQTAPAASTANADAATPAGSASDAATGGTTTSGTSGKAAGGGTATGGTSGKAAGGTAKTNSGRRSGATPTDKVPATPTDKVPATTEGTRNSAGRPTNDLSKAMKNGRH